MSHTPEPDSRLLLTPPHPGFCHAARCEEQSGFIVRIRRLSGAWTLGLDYCEQHAHEVAGRLRNEAMKVVVEPINSAPVERGE